jgi:hypothetical protein
MDNETDRKIIFLYLWIVLPLLLLEFHYQMTNVVLKKGCRHKCHRTKANIWIAEWCHHGLPNGIDAWTSNVWWSSLWDLQQASQGQRGLHEVKIGKLTSSNRVWREGAFAPPRSRKMKWMTLFASMNDAVCLHKCDGNGSVILQLLSLED